MGLFKQLMIFGKTGLQGLPTRVTLFLWAFSRQGATRVPLLYSSLLLAVSNYGSGSHIDLFWQKSPVELITIGSRPSGGIRTFFGVFATPQFVQALFTVYVLHELKVPGPFKDH